MEKKMRYYHENEWRVMLADWNEVEALMVEFLN
jgi:hypothetical protein